MRRPIDNDCRESSQLSSPESTKFYIKETRNGFGKSGPAPDTRDRRELSLKDESDRPRLGQ